ncbi:hypothetical protein EIP86_003300 [Pleurotus ostreatoroseus]|nr:hypothetical protein EIP86_003300 [Pleurotus ostreatoroseus]
MSPERTGLLVIGLTALVVPACVRLLTSPVALLLLAPVILILATLSDFVLSWYRDLSTSPSFPTAVSATVHNSLQKVLSRAANLDVPALLIKRILPKVTAHIEQFRESEMALRGAGLERRLTQSEELDLLLASRYATRGGGKLHPAVDNLSSTFTKQTEENHLRKLIGRALPYILPEKEANSEALKVVVREVLACSVFYPLMDMLADPDFWNRSIDQVAGAAIRQQKLISKVRNVLEAQLPRAHTPAAEPSISHAAERITTRTDARKFESFLRSINRCSSLLDARRLKNDIISEIRRTRALLANHEKDEWINGEKTEDIVAFLDRLYTAKRKVEKRIIALGGEADPRTLSSINESSTTDSRVSLRDVLTNPTFLSYFMEFMDRRNRALLVQFWLTVESFKNPLESVDSDSSDDEDETVNDPALSNNLKEDISMMNELYFSSAAVEPVLSVISPKHINVIRSFGTNGDEDVAPAAERRVRRSVMLAQRQVERDMEQQDFEDFQRSELWFRIIGESEGTRRVSPEASRAQSLQEDTHRHLPEASRSETAPPRFLQRSATAPFTVSETHEHATSASSTGVVSLSPPALPRGHPSSLELLMSSSGGARASPSAPARAPLFDDPEDARFDAALEVQSQRMEAIQAALTDIIALDRHENPTIEGVSEGDSLNGSMVLTEEPKGEGGSDEEGEVEDHHEGPSDEHGSFQLAGPGDLHLSYEIDRLGNKIGNLQTQEGMLDTLIKKAELTGDAQELRLLQKSKSSLERDLRELNFQKIQYEQQESANRLVSDRTRIAIVNSTVGDEDGKAVVRYLVEVQQLATDGSFASGWVIARRYNEFFQMHNKLRERYALVRGLDFPGKRLVTSLSSSFVDSRRIALEKYMQVSLPPFQSWQSRLIIFLQSLIAIPAVCESEELRLFLSRDSESAPAPTSSARPAGPKKGLVRSMYQSVAESIDDMFFGPSMLDVIIQRLTTQAAELVGIVGTGVHDEDLVAQALRASAKTTEDSLLQLPGDLKPLEGETSTSSFSSPICDLILAVFELNKNNNWLRRQAIVIILQQVFGGTIERKLRETVKSQLDETHLLSYVNLFKDAMWQDGQLKTGGPPRTAEEKLRTRDDANKKLSALIPGNPLS